MKKAYSIPEMEVIGLGREDMILTSGCDIDDMEPICGCDVPGGYDSCYCHGVQGQEK